MPAHVIEGISVGQSVIGQREIRILLDGLLELRNAGEESSRGSLIPKRASIYVGFVRRVVFALLRGARRSHRRHVR